MVGQETPKDLEQEKVVQWRALQLLNLGFSLEQVMLLTSNPNLDWHRAEYLLHKGMPRELIVNELT